MKVVYCADVSKINEAEVENFSCYTSVFLCSCAESTALSILYLFILFTMVQSTICRIEGEKLKKTWVFCRSTCASFGS